MYTFPLILPAVLSIAAFPGVWIGN